MISNKLAAIALAIIALSQVSNALAIYQADTGGHNVCLGNFCYHIAQQGESGL